MEVVDKVSCSDLEGNKLGHENYLDGIKTCHKNYLARAKSIFSLVNQINQEFRLILMEVHYPSS